MIDKEKLAQKVKDAEYSKRFTTSIRNCMFIHLGLTILIDGVLIFLGYSCSEINDILIAMMPLYISLQGANYIKSGYENGKKIAGSTTTTTDESDNG